MKHGTAILVFVISAIAFFVYGQGRGMINHIEREKVIAIVSSLKPEMTEEEGIKFLLDHGLNWDWGSIWTNHTERWYRFGTTNIEELRITFQAKRDMSYKEWGQQHGTNSTYFKAEIFRVEKGGLAGIWGTNAFSHTTNDRPAL
ncbi:MAG TPA: hypothetical protein VFC07_06010 [Verrucomicrobiae bacterium]|nr:hypothetical protein [Verrucomicrobiae bacterium]